MRLDPVRTERLVARSPRAGDEGNYRRLLLSPEVFAWLRPAAPAPITDVESTRLLTADREHWVQHGFGPWVLLDEATERFLGRAGLKHVTVAGEQVVELTWAVLPERQGAGLATEAAETAVTAARQLGLAEVVAFALTTNAASRRVMEKIGMRRAEDIEHAGLAHVLCRLRLK